MTQQYGSLTVLGVIAVLVAGWVLAGTKIGTSVLLLLLAMILILLLRNYQQVINVFVNKG